MRFLYPEVDMVVESIEVDEAALPPAVDQLTLLTGESASACEAALDAAVAAIRVHGRPIEGESA